LGTSVPLTNGVGLDANFGIQRWDNQKWAAGVNGSGTLARTDVEGNVNVQMNGGAAGTYGSGSFSGTAAGTAK
jgi:hypothetical protein